MNEKKSRSRARPYAPNEGLRRHEKEQHRASYPLTFFADNKWHGRIINDAALAANVK